MIDKIIDILREYPALPLFLTIGIGFLLGRLKIKSFTLGSVTAVLLVGVVVGQLDIPISGAIKSVFFMMFLFSIGYSVGPKFFRSLKGLGLKQALFAVMMGSCCFAATLGLSELMGYTKGETVGLFSGSQTCSALIGLGSESIHNLPIPEEEKAKELAIIPVCYAVTYIFGTLGTVIILGNLGPRLLGGLDKVKKDTQELERNFDQSSSTNDPAYVDAMRKVTYRSYRVENDYFLDGRSVKETEKYLRNAGLVVYIDRLRRNGDIENATGDKIIRNGDDIVVCGRNEYIIEVEDYVGIETSDDKMLAYPVQCVPVRIVNKKAVGHTVGNIRAKEFMHGVMVLSVDRDGREVEVKNETVLQKGDVMTVIGRDTEVKYASSNIGFMDKPSVASDLMFFGLAIFIGGFFGAITIWLGKIPVSFGTSGGALLAGLVFGWLRSKHPIFGYIPNSALWLMNNLGLNVFIAIIGIEAGPSFISGLKEVGPMLFVIGMAATTIPLLFGIFIGQKIFKFHPALTLGCCAGTRTCTASLGAVQNTLGSTLPAMGYTVTYAVSNILLVIWGLVTVIIAG